MAATARTEPGQGQKLKFQSKYLTQVAGPQTLGPSVCSLKEGIELELEQPGYELAAICFAIHIDRS